MLEVRDPAASVPRVQLYWSRGRGGGTFGVDLYEEESMGATAAGAAAIAVIIANAVKASGVVVRVEPADFLTILARADTPLVVTGEGGVFNTHYQYLTSYKGLGFFTKSSEPIVLPAHVEVVRAESISIPDI